MNTPNIKPFVFVLMPFDPDFDDVYQLGIKAACLSAGAYCERVDEQIFAENILERVYNQIAKADIIVSEMTGRNPNVFYETGYAHALKKQVILLTQNATDIPFDLKHYPHIVYNGKISQLKTDLEKRVTWFINNPGASLTKVDIDFEFFINGMSWQEGLEIQIGYNNDRNVNTLPINFRFEIGLHNISNRVIEEASYHLALIVPGNLKVYEDKGDVEAVIKIEKDRLIRMTDLGSIFPQDWGNVKTFFTTYKTPGIPFPSKFILRLFSELGPKDFPFEIKFIEL